MLYCFQRVQLDLGVFQAFYNSTSRSIRVIRVARHATLWLQAMREGCSALVGEHDFRNLCTHDVANVTHFNRRQPTTAH